MILQVVEDKDKVFHWRNTRPRIQYPYNWISVRVPLPPDGKAQWRSRCESGAVPQLWVSRYANKSGRPLWPVLHSLVERRWERL